MAHPLRNLDGRRYVGDRERQVVHDTWHDECEDCIIEDLVHRDRAVGFAPDTLGQAFEEGYDYCDWCVDGSDPEPKATRSERSERRPPAFAMVG
jgi:hypothetical protein